MYPVRPWRSVIAEDSETAVFQLDDGAGTDGGEPNFDQGGVRRVEKYVPRVTETAWRIPQLDSSPFVLDAVGADLIYSPAGPGLEHDLETLVPAHAVRGGPPSGTLLSPHPEGPLRARFDQELENDWFAQSGVFSTKRRNLARATPQISSMNARTSFAPESESA